MAEKRVIRTSGLNDEFRVGDLVVTPKGIEVTADEAKAIFQAAAENNVRVTLDDETPADADTRTPAEIEAQRRVDEEFHGGDAEPVTPVVVPRSRRGEGTESTEGK